VWPELGFQIYCNQMLGGHPGMAADNKCMGGSSDGMSTKDFLKQLSGWDDFASCFSTSGPWSSCGWAALDAASYAAPLAKAARLTKLADTGMGLAAAEKIAAIMDKLTPAERGILAALTCNSFTGDTKVLMADGTSKPIEDVKVGDVVEGTDATTWAKGPHKVTALIRHSGQHRMVDVTLADGSVIHSTDQHPFWDATTGSFNDAIDLKPGDRLRTPDGVLVPVSATRVYEENLTAYNLTIDSVHTYYVVAGDTSVLVHNADETACGPHLVLALDRVGGKDFLGTYAASVDGVTWKDPQFRDLFPNMQTTDTSLHTMIDRVVQGSGKITFNIGGMQDIPAILDGTSAVANKWTAIELRYICSNPAARGVTTFVGGDAPC
jgi:hypothetical protein